MKIRMLWKISLEFFFFSGIISEEKGIWKTPNKLMIFSFEYPWLYLKMKIPFQIKLFWSKFLNSNAI